MEQISVIARRLKNGLVQYGWSSGSREEIGRRLMRFYRSPERIDGLFELGKARLCRSEQDIFCRKKEAVNAFFCEADGSWYDVYRGPFHIKVPLELILCGMDQKGCKAVDCLGVLEKGLIEYMLLEYLIRDEIFEALVRKNSGDAGGLLEMLLSCERPMAALYRMKWLYCYFDHWAEVFADDRGEKVIGYSLAPVKRRRRETVMR